MSVFITGAMETSPGVMTVDYIQRFPTAQAPAERVMATVKMPTTDYLSCWDNN